MKSNSSSPFFAFSEYWRIVRWEPHLASAKYDRTMEQVYVIEKLARIKLAMEKTTVKFIKGLNIVRCDMRIYYTPPFYWVGTRNDYITYDQETNEKVVVELVNKELGMMCLQ